jgi:hypothetical protein
LPKLVITNPKRFWFAVAVLAGLIAGIQIPRAYAIYFHLGPYRNGPGQLDLHYRWQEVHYLLRGKNPFDVAFANSPAAHAVEPVQQELTARDATVEPDLGVPKAVVYPPWAYPTELLFHWPTDWKVQAFYYAWVMAAGLTVVFAWTRREVITGPSGMSMAVPLAAIAVTSWASAIVVGNNPLVVVPLLIGCYLLLGRGEEVLAGAVLGGALLKPTLTGPFVLILFLRGRWRALASTTAYLILASLLTWYLTATNPLEMLTQMFAASKQWVGEGFGPVQYMIRSGMPAQSANVVTGTAVIAMGACALWTVRNASLLAQFAVAAIIARFWSYHLYYDDAVMVFALVAFARETLGRNVTLAYTGFVLSCIGLWTPYRASLLLPVQMVQLGIWVVLAYLVIRVSSARNQPPDCPSSSSRGGVACSRV